MVLKHSGILKSDSAIWGGTEFHISSSCQDMTHKTEMSTVWLQRNSPSSSLFLSVVPNRSTLQFPCLCYHVYIILCFNFHKVVFWTYWKNTNTDIQQTDGLVLSLSVALKMLQPLHRPQADNEDHLNLFGFHQQPYSLLQSPLSLFIFSTGWIPSALQRIIWTKIRFDTFFAITYNNNTNSINTCLVDLNSLKWNVTVCYC